METSSIQIKNDGPPLPSTKTETQQRWQRLGFLAVIVVPLVATIYAAITLTRGTVLWLYPTAAIIGFCIAGLGVTAGYHRMLTHEAFKAHPAVQYALLICGAIAGMASPIIWAHKHLHHHIHSDTDEDIHSPHTPRFHGWVFEGLFQWTEAHMGWIFRDQSVPISQKALQVTNTSAARFVHRTWGLWLVAGLFLPLCFGWNAFVWVGAVRLFLNHHVTWSVNSVCHLWGQQPFPHTKDSSKNNPLLGLLALGEGWHNNHHFRPRSARHGLLRGQLDLTYGLICLLERCKLVYGVQRYVRCPQCQDWHPRESAEEAICTQCRKRI